MIKATSIILLFLHTVILPQTAPDDFGKAKHLFNSGDYAAAHIIFQKLSLDVDIEKYLSSTAKYYSAECLFNLKQIDGAISEYEEFISIHRFSNFRDIALFKLGTIYYESRQYRKSRESLLKIIREYPASEFKGSAYYWIGKCFTAEDRFGEAEEFLKEAISDQTNKYIDHTLYALGNLYEEISRCDEAIVHFDELLAYYKESSLIPYAQLRIGVCYFKLGEYDKAVLELSDPAINELPGNLRNEANYILANSFLRLKEYKNASDTYKKLLDEYPDEKIAREVEYGLAWISFQMREYEDAFNTFNKLSNSGRDSIAVNSFYWKAESKRYLGDTEEAAKLYTTFLEVYPQSKLVPSVKYNLGVIDFSAKRFAESERNLIAALSSENKDVLGKANTLLGELALNKKDFETARMYFTGAIRISFLDDVIANRAILGLGVAEFSLNNFDEAINNLMDLSVRHQRFETVKVNFYLAESYFAKKNYDNALRFYSRVNTEEEPLKRLTLYGRAYSYFNLKDFPNSLFYFKEYVKIYPNDENYSECRLRLADSYYGIKDFESASRIYGEVFTKDPRVLNNDFAYYQYGQSLFKAGKSREAIEKFETLQKKFRQSRYADNSQYLIGWIYFQQSNFYEAIKNYKEIFARYPRSAIKPVAIYSIGDSYYNLGEYDSALIYYGKLINQFPNTQYVIDAINGIQYSYLAKDEPDKAVKVIDEYVKKNPSAKISEEIFLKKGETYYSLGRYSEARNGYLEFIEKFPKSGFLPEAYYWVGKSASITGNDEEATGYFQFVIDRYLKSKYGIDAVLEYGKILFKQKDLQKAHDVYKTVIPKVPDDKRVPEIIFEKALVEIELNNISAAYQSFNELINYYDGTIFGAKAKIELAILEMARLQYDNAVSLLRELGERRTDDIGAQSQYLIGAAFYEQAKYNEAILALVRVRSVFSDYEPWYSRALLKLGDCYVKLNDKRNARDMYRAVLNKHSRNELGAEAREKLNKL